VQSTGLSDRLHENVSSTPIPASTIGIIGASQIGLRMALAAIGRGGRARLFELDPERRKMVEMGGYSLLDEAFHRRVQSAIKSGGLVLVDSVEGLVRDGSFIYLCLDAQYRSDGSADLSQVAGVAAELNRTASNTKEPAIVVVTSAVPCGTGDWLSHLLGAQFHVVSVRRVRIAVDGSDNLVWRTLVGALRPDIGERVAKIVYPDSPSLVTGHREVELIAHAANSLMAMRLSIANELASIAHSVGADAQTVLKAVKLDRRIDVRSKTAAETGHHHLYGDLGVLTAMARVASLETPALTGAATHQARRVTNAGNLAEMVGDVNGRSFGVWGLNSSNGKQRRWTGTHELLRSIVAAGGKVKAFDPALVAHAGKSYSGVTLTADKESAARDADVLLVLSRRPEFEAADWESVRQLMRAAVIVDGCRSIDPAAVTQAGFVYRALRPSDGNTNGESRKKAPAAPVTARPAHANGHAAAGSPPSVMQPQVITGRAYLSSWPESVVDEAGPPTAGTNPSRAYDVLKRGIDLAVALIAGTLLLPLLASVALIILFEDGGPVIFRSSRVGMGGRIFTMYKFRTMRVGAPRFGNKSDTGSYLTRVGRLLRQVNIDELPQLWNILRGDMSLVGPRPEQPHIVDWYQSWQRERLSVRPGLTGWWQIKMRAKNQEMYQHVEHDVWYVRHRSIWLDLVILARTALLMIGPA
jgi:nucleotide sugar dehydrogenase